MRKFYDYIFEQKRKVRTMTLEDELTKTITELDVISDKVWALVKENEDILDNPAVKKIEESGNKIDSARFLLSASLKILGGK
jgi:hypothetical protein